MHPLTTQLHELEVLTDLVGFICVPSKLLTRSRAIYFEILFGVIAPVSYIEQLRDLFNYKVDV